MSVETRMGRRRRRSFPPIFAVALLLFGLLLAMPTSGNARAPLPHVDFPAGTFRGTAGAPLGGSAPVPFDCSRLHPADLIPLRVAERNFNAYCSAEHRPQVAGIPPSVAHPSAGPTGFGIYNLAMTYDAADRYVLMLGATGVGALNGTQTWAFTAGNWSEVFPTSSPESCVGSSLAYDDIDGYVVYLGGANLGSGANCSSAGETWTYAGGVWTRLSPTNSPPARQAAGFTNDSPDGYMLLFGGLSSFCTLVCNDTWTFLAGQWTQLAPLTSPSNRSGVGMTYDAADGYVLLFGGSSDASCRGPYQNSLGCMDRDTWSFHAGAWTQLSPVGAVPPEPFDDGMTYSAADQAVLYTVTDDNLSSDPEIWWTFHGGNWTNPVNNSWWTPGNTSLPANRFGEGLAYDWTDHYSVLFGGAGISWNWLHDTWSYVGGNWTNLTSPGPPPPPVYVLYFNETGLAVGTLWSVTVGGFTYQSTLGTIQFLLSNGSYAFVVPSVPGYDVSPMNGTVVINGALGSVPVFFSPITGTPSYPVTFVEYGLPAGTAWSSTVNGVVYTATVPTLVVSLENGTWPFLIGGVPGYVPSPMYGNVTVAGLPLTVVSTFLLVNPSFSVQFQEVGLPPGSLWHATLGSTGASTSGETLTIETAPGTYGFTVGSAAGFVASPSSGILNVTTDVVLYIIFSPAHVTTFLLSFEESGLPNGTAWSVVVDGTTLVGTGGTLGIEVSNGSHSFSVGGIVGFSADPTSGSAAVAGHPVFVPISFTSSSTPNTGANSSGSSSLADFYLGTTVGILVGLGLGVLIAVLLLRRPRPPRPS